MVLWRVDVWPELLAHLWQKVGTIPNTSLSRFELGNIFDRRWVTLCIAPWKACWYELCFSKWVISHIVLAHNSILTISGGSLYVFENLQWEQSRWPTADFLDWKKGGIMEDYNVSDLCPFSVTDCVLSHKLSTAKHVLLISAHSQWQEVYCPANWALQGMFYWFLPILAQYYRLWVAIITSVYNLV